MTTRQRIGMGAVAAVLGLCVLAALAWHVWLPAEIRGRVAEAASRRGLRASVGSVEIGFGRLRLRQVEAVGGHPAALRIEADEIQTDVGLWAIAIDGSSAIRALTLRGVAVTAELGSPALPRVIRRLRGRERGEERAVGAERALRFEGLSVELRDERGPLARLSRARLSVEPGGPVRLTAGPVELAPEMADGARAERVQARLERTEDGLRISYASLRTVAIRYRERDGDDHSPLWQRIREDARRLSPGDGQARRDGEPEEDGDGGATGLLTRARELIGPRLAPNAVLRLDELSVVASSAEGEQTVLRELEAEVRALTGGRFQLEGSGRPGRGGRLGWRLVVDPDELRAEGRVDFQRLPFVLVVPLLPSLPWHRPEDARLSGELSIEGRGATRLRLSGQVTVDELGLSSPRIAPRPVQHISMGLSGRADWDPITRRLELESGTLAVGSTNVHVAGSLEWPEDHYLIDLRATLPPTDCNTAVSAIPADLLADLNSFSFSGRIGARVEARIDSRDLDATALEIRVADGCRFETAPVLADVRRFQAPFTHRVLEPDGTTFEMETGPTTVAWTSIRDVSPFLVHAVLGHEDGGFFQHNGFADHAVRLALVRNLRAGRYVYGASTITMQLVKNVFLHREKTLARKVQEVLLTWWVESVMSKEQILELYLNVIEYGPGVYGIRNAAHHYFGRSPDELGPAESAYLATILPNPKAYHSHYRDDALPESFRRRVARFLQTLGARGRFDPAAVSLGIEQLGAFDFHQLGDARPPDPMRRGGTAPLPFGPSLDRAWEEALGPDDPQAADEEEGAGLER